MTDMDNNVNQQDVYKRQDNDRWLLLKRGLLVLRLLLRLGLARRRKGRIAAGAI